MSKIGPAEEVCLRAYAPGDALAMAQLYFDSVCALGPRGYTPEQVAAWAPEPAEPARVHERAGDGRVTVVAVNAAGEVLAYGDLEPDGHLDHLYVHPKAAGQGVGSRIIDALLARAAEQAVARVYVEASEIARPVFERKGFVLLGRRDFEVRGVAIHNYAMEWSPPKAG